MPSYATRSAEPSPKPNPLESTTATCNTKPAATPQCCWLSSYPRHRCLTRCLLAYIASICPFVCSAGAIAFGFAQLHTSRPPTHFHVPSELVACLPCLGTIAYPRTPPPQTGCYISPRHRRRASAQLLATCRVPSPTSHAPLSKTVRYAHARVALRLQAAGAGRKWPPL